MNTARATIVVTAMRHPAIVPLLTALALGACGGAALDAVDPAASAETEPLEAIHPGESMRFEVRLAGVLAGEAHFTTEQPTTRDGRPAIALVSRIRSAGALALVKDVRDEATTVLDLDTLLPLSTVSDVKANPRDYHAETTYTDNRATVVFRPATGASQTLHYDFRGEPLHDAHSAMVAMRVWEAAPGATRTIWVLGGRRVWHSEVTMGQPEVIGTYVGNQPALRIDGIARRARPDLSIDEARKPRSFSVWLSDDADRVPFRFVARTELGDVTIDLVEYQRP